MNPDVEPDDWETIEKPEELVETVSAAEKDTAKSDSKASKTADKAVSETIEENHAVEEKEAKNERNILLKDW